MDSGDVIPCLNEDWTFGGCKLFEWLAGLTTAFLVILIWIGTTLGMAMLRKKFPDEERGVRNMCMVACGFEPPGIPAPAKLQPRWSGGRIEILPESCNFQRLELYEVVAVPRDEGA
jgi:hypothetical protein